VAASGDNQYQALVAQVQELEQELHASKLSERKLKHELEQQQKIAARRQTQLKTVQTLNLAVFSGLREADIYQMACQSVVHQIGWDVAFVISMSGGRGTILASYHATEKQLGHLGDYLNQNSVLTEAYAHHAALVTHNAQDKQALVLRSLFQVEEVVALPILFGEQCFGYLVAGETSTTAPHGREEVDFLAGVATLLAYAVQQNASVTNLEEQNKKLRQLDELKDSFISITSHQLRTPLSIIKWILSILQGDKDLLKLPDQSKMIGQAYETNERLIHVVNDLLNVSRIQEGKLPHNPQPADISVFIKELCDNAKPLFATKNITLNVTIEEGLPMLDLDPLLFKEAVQNLLDNAMDYNLPEKGLVSVDVKRDKQEVILEIKNAGSQIPLEDQSKIFEQFYRSPQAVSIHPNGNGLGLYLARAIITEHKGTLELTSSTDEVTVFTIKLPVT
jgi:signal transduction histidine kinase